MYLFILRAVAAGRAHFDEDGERRRGRLLPSRGGSGRRQAALHGGPHVVEAIAPRHPRAIDDDRTKLASDPLVRGWCARGVPRSLYNTPMTEGARAAKLSTPARLGRNIMHRGPGVKKDDDKLRPAVGRSEPEGATNKGGWSRKENRATRPGRRGRERERKRRKPPLVALLAASLSLLKATRDHTHHRTYTDRADQ